MWRKISKEEFIIFLDNYPGNLEYDWTGISHPPICSYNDFTRGKWPESMVARFAPHEDGSRDYYILCPYPDIECPYIERRRGRIT